MTHFNELKEDYLNVIRGALKALRKNDISSLKEISNHTIHDASIFQDELSISLAITIYSLSKIIEREGKTDPKIESILNNSAGLISRNDFEGLKENIKKLFKLISDKDTRLKLYIDEVFRQARIKKGGKIYEHGISIGQVAEILGISQWELMSYVGKTKIAEYATPKISAQQRIAVAKEIFEIK